MRSVRLGMGEGLDREHDMVSGVVFKHCFQVVNDLV